MIQMLKLGTEENYLNITKATYDKPSANVIPNLKKPEPFPRDQKQDNQSLSSLLANMALKVLPRAKRQGNK